MNFFARYFTSEVSWIFSLNDIYVDMIYATLSFYCNTGLYWLPKYDVDNETDYFFWCYQISNFVIGLYFLSVVNKFGISSVYLGFSAVCVLAVLYIAGNVVETKGRSLEEIERALSAST